MTCIWTHWKSLCSMLNKGAQSQSFYLTLFSGNTVLLWSWVTMWLSCITNGWATAWELGIHILLKHPGYDRYLATGSTNQMKASQEQLFMSMYVWSVQYVSLKGYYNIAILLYSFICLELQHVWIWIMNWKPKFQGETVSDRLKSNPNWQRVYKRHNPYFII